MGESFRGESSRGGTSRRRNVLAGAKRLGGETARGKNVELPYSYLTLRFARYHDLHNIGLCFLRNDTKTTTKEYLSRVAAARVETYAEKRNLGQMCHALICRRIEPAERTMPLISLELSHTER